MSPSNEVHGNGALPPEGDKPSKKNGHKRTFENEPLPVDEYAERCVIAGCMIAKEYLDRALECLIPSDFHVARNCQIFKVIAEYAARGSAVTNASIKVALQSRNQFETIGSDDYWTAVVTSLRSVIEFDGFLEIVKETALVRGNISVLRDALSLSYRRAASPFDLIEKVKRELDPLSVRAKGIVYDADYVMLDKVEPRSVKWLWPGRIPLGMITLVSGDPGFGKSYIGYALATAVSLGRGWFDAPGWRDDPGDTVLIQAEDPKHETIAPRLIAMGADRSRIALVQGTRMRDGGVKKFTLDDLRTLRTMHAKLPRLKLVVIDPLGSYIGKRSEIATADIRDVMDPLKDWAEQNEVAVVCMIHLNKNESMQAMHRASGSMAFAAAPRFFYTVGVDPENPDRNILVCVKTNIAKKPEPLGYKITDRFEWDTRTSGATADEVARYGLSTEKAAPKRQAEAQDRIREMLESGPEYQPRILNALQLEGFGRQTIWDAKKALIRLGTIREMAGDNKRIKLKLTKHDEPEAPDAPEAK